MADPSCVRVHGALAACAAGFAEGLVRQGYAPSSARQQMYLMAHLSRWLAAEGLEAHQLGAAEVERFVEARCAAGYADYRTGKALRPLLNYLQDLGVVPVLAAPAADGPVEVALGSYWRYLTAERGLGGAAARGYLNAVRPFLRRRLSPTGLALDLAQLTSADVTAFVVDICHRQARGTAKLTVTALRSLLRFLQVEGLIKHPLSAAVPAIAGWRLAGLPKGLEDAQVQSLLASCDCRTRKGRRDFAILTALTRLGLRAGEVAALRLDDIDWRAGEIVVQGKGNRTERLPLPADVGEAMAAYLRHGRPANAQERTVFVRVRAPLRPLTPSGITLLVAAAARRAGLGQIYAHRLRHTVATQLLRAGASLPEIGQLLRHRRAGTTAIYAKVDRDALRTIARPWPGGAP